MITGSKHKPESIVKMKFIHSGKIISEETKKRMSEAQKRIGNKPPIRINNEHHSWKDDMACYGSKHTWIYRRFGQANKCENREEQILNFKCRNKTNTFEWCNISGNYIRERSDWLKLCRSCHRLMDMTEEKMNKALKALKKAQQTLHEGQFKKGQIPWNVKYITFNNKTQSITTWAKKLGINHTALLWRLKNWELERALTTPNRYA